MARPGEESVRVETGKQVVYPTVMRGGIVDLCEEHRRINDGHSNYANQLASQLDLPVDEQAALEPHMGTCAECARNTLPGPLTEQLDQALPVGYRKKLDQSDRTPHKPFTPGQSRTKPLPPLPQSLNAVQKPMTLYRGIYLGKPEAGEIDQLHRDPESYYRQYAEPEAGIHWTTSPEIARHFAMGRDAEGYWGGIHDDPDAPEHRHGVVLHAQVDPRHIVQYGTPEWDDYSAEHDIFSDSPEQETTVRKDAPIHVTHLTGVSGDPDWPQEDRHTTVPVRHHVTAAREELQPLPSKLYHVTTARDAVLEHGLKTRNELGQQYGHGLGGGRDDTISLTVHKPTAEHLLHSLHEYHDVLNGKITADDLIDKAKRGVGAPAAFDHLVTGGNDYYNRAKDLEGDRTHVHGVHLLGEQPEGWEPAGESIGEHHSSGKPIHMEWTRPVTDKERTHARSDLYKSFAWGRQFAGGHMDPLFIANDPESFAAKDPKQFALLHVRSREGAHGIQMNDRSDRTDAGEWRATSGKDLDVVGHESHKDITPRIARKKANLGEATDWDAHYDKLPGTVHRGYALKIPGKLYDLIHDHDVDPSEVAEQLVARTAKRASSGMHWSADEGQAREFASKSPRTGSSDLPIVLHADRPAREDIETRPSVLKRQQVMSHGHWEQEVPVRKGRQMNVTGISWRPLHDHPAADEEGWVHHTLGRGVSHTAAKWPMKYTTYGPNGGYVDKETEIEGPLFHGSRSRRLQPGDLITKGRKPNEWGDQGPKSQYVHFTTRHDTARSYADQAGGHVYEVEPTGEFSMDYNGDDYKTKHPLRVVRVVPPEERTASKTAEMTPERKAEIERIRQERKNRKRRPAGQSGADALSRFFTPIPEHELEEQRKARVPKPERLDNKTYSIDDVSKHYDWEGFDPYEIEHLVHNPEHAQFTHEDVPVHSLRHIGEHGQLVKPPSYHDIAAQDEDDEDWEKERLRSLERGHDEGANIPPIVVVRHGEHHIIADGSHRAAVAAERGHTHIPAFVTERTIMPKQASRRTAALHNPNAKKGQPSDEWYHGSPADFSEFYDTSSSNDDEDRVNHWNVLLGNHFTATHNVAHDFSLSLHHPGDKNGYDGEEPLGHVIHARLHIKRPKVYDSEHDMDQEVHEHEVKHGNLLDPHLPEPPHEDADEDEWDDYYDHAGHARVYRGDSQGPFGKNERDPNVAYGFHPKATGWLNHHPDKEGIAARFKKRLMEQGYDGIVYGNEFERADGGGKERSVIAFHPHQIEITQHHYGKTSRCLTPEEAKRQPGPDQEMIPGTEHYRRTLSMLGMKMREDTGRLATPLPSECWDRFYGMPITDWPTAKDLKISKRLISAWDDDDDWDEEEEPEGYYCPACGEDHEDEETRDRHLTTYTDWDRVHPHLNDTVHRVLPHMRLPDHVHEIVRDESRPLHERGKALLDHIADEHGHELGMHWSDVFGEGESRGADKFAGVGGGHPDETQVVLHARTPDRRHIEADPDTLDDHQVFGYGEHDEHEVPIRRYAPVHITGVSWRPGGYHQEWRRHDLKEPMHMTAMRKHAHDSGDSQRIFHCPFCGGGQVIGRSDGTTECEFCGTHFTVQVQPTFNSFPQTDPATGMPIQIPGMPGQIDTSNQMPPGAPGAPGDESGDFDPGIAPDGGEEDDTDAQEDSEDDGDDGGDNKPDFLKSKSSRMYTSMFGDKLTEDQYVRHLAWMMKNAQAQLDPADIARISGS